LAERYSCVAASRECGEPLYGTASHVRRWILLEQPGPWGADAVLQSRMRTETARALHERARQAGARLLLIRRHGRYEPVGRTCLVAVTTARVQRVERLVLGEPAELLEVDWSPLAALEPVGGEELHDPVFLVCTNGRHDPCCAEHGRPLVKALGAAYGEQVWESSHFGGDRFAGNLVCLPDGLYYGHVDPADGPRLAALYADGELDLEHLRGRSAYPFPVQAAEHFVRRDEQLTRLDDLTVVRSRREDGGRFSVTFRRRDGSERRITVEQGSAGVGQQLTCKALSRLNPPRFHPVAG
jgi:hypothetical protein